MILLTSRDNVLGFNLKVDQWSPWMIFAKLAFTPQAFERTSASNPDISLSERDSLFPGTKRIGTNWDDLLVPSSEIRWTS
jgi:hypothetical protein